MADYILTVTYAGRFEGDRLRALASRQVTRAACLGGLDNQLAVERHDLLGEPVSIYVEGASLLRWERWHSSYYSHLVDLLYVARKLCKKNSAVLHIRVGCLCLLARGQQAPDLHHAFLAWQLWRQPEQDTGTVRQLVQQLDSRGIARNKKLLLMLEYLWQRAQGPEAAQYSTPHQLVSVMTTTKPPKAGVLINSREASSTILWARVCRRFVPTPPKGKAAAVDEVAKWLERGGEPSKAVLGAATKLLPPEIQDAGW